MTDQQFEQKLASIDLSAVMGRVQRELGLDEESAAKAEDLYRKFLTLRHRYPASRHVPPKIADEVWHNHIMHTKQYLADCEKLFGDVLHHVPELEGDQSSHLRDYDQTVKHYKQEFGVELGRTSLLPSKWRGISDCGG